MIISHAGTDVGIPMKPHGEPLEHQALGGRRGQGGNLHELPRYAGREEVQYRAVLG